MFIPDTSDNASSYELTFDKLARWIVLILSFFAIIICLFVSVILRNNEAMYGENGYEARIEALREENNALKQELEEISRSSEKPAGNGKNKENKENKADKDGKEKEEDAESTDPSK